MLLGKRSVPCPDSLILLSTTAWVKRGTPLYTNDPRDPGGPTKYGIALNANRAAIPDKDGNGIINAEMPRT